MLKCLGGSPKFIFLTTEQVVRLLGFEVLFLSSQKGKEKKKIMGRTH